MTLGQDFSFGAGAHYVGVPIIILLNRGSFQVPLHTVTPIKLLLLFCMNQHNNLEGGPVPDSDPPSAQEAPPDPMTQLVQAMAILVQVLTMQLASNLSKSKTIQ